MNEMNKRFKLSWWARPLLYLFWHAGRIRFLRPYANGVVSWIMSHGLLTLQAGKWRRVRHTIKVQWHG